MKTRLLYDIVTDTFNEVQIFCQHSDGMCFTSAGWHHRSTMEIPFNARPNQRKIPFIDPLVSVINRGTLFWGSCVAPSPFPSDNGAARWIGTKKLYTPLGQEIATLQPALTI